MCGFCLRVPLRQRLRTWSHLVAARALQGIGGGLVISVALTAVGLAYPQRLRARAFAANSMVWGTLGFGGPVITAGLLAVAGWRMIFVVQLPITALGSRSGVADIAEHAGQTAARRHGLSRDHADRWLGCCVVVGRGADG